MLSPKELKKFVETCRKLGVKEFTSPEFSFKLTDDAPISHVPKSHKSQLPMTPQIADSEEETLSSDALLFWSSQDLTDSSVQ